MIGLASVRAPLRSAWLDPVLALLACTLTELELLDGFPHRHGSKVLLAVLVVAMTSALAWRRRAPLAFALWVAALESAIGLSLASIADSQTSLWLLVLVPYTAGALLPGRKALLGTGAVLASSVAVGFAWSQQPIQDSTFVIAAILVSAGFGRMVRSRRHLDRTLRRRTARLAAEREDRERLAVSEERSRIARELHAVVADSVSAMVVQAGAAQRLLEAGDSRADAAMQSIEAMGRATLGEIRRMLGVLRDSGEGMPLTPQPGVARMHELVGSALSRGRAVTLDLEGEPTGLSPGVDLALFRIAEDLLESTSDEAPAAITLRYRQDEVELEICAQAASGSEWPTVKARERIALCRGSSERQAGERGLERVRVRLPRGASGGGEPRRGAQAQGRESLAASPGLMTPSS